MAAVPQTRADESDQPNTYSVTPSQMVQGGVGLWQTPTARMMPEGALSMSYTDNQEYRFMSVSLQLFPWMEATARYTDVRTRLYSNVDDFSGDQTLKDKGLDVKFRLWEESFYLPDISVGFRDFGGTGFFESEFVNASKAVGPFDFHLGLGWGHLGYQNDFTNPFCELRESFCERPDGFSGRGGKVDYQNFFKGPMAVFGGIEYQTPLEGLSLKAEFEGNNYQQDRAGALEQDSRWNFGAVYRWNNFDFSLNYQRGNTIGFGVSYKLNMHTVSQVKIDNPPREIQGIKPPENAAAVKRQKLYNDLRRHGGYVITDLEIDDEQATFYGLQTRYRDRNEGVERVGRILASELPESIQQYHLVEQSNNVPMVDTIIDAAKFREHATYSVPESSVEDTYRRVSPTQQQVDAYEPHRATGAFFSTKFFWTQTFGNPEDFYLYQIGLLSSVGYKFNEHLGIYGGIRTTLLDNFDKFNFTVDAEETFLPRVRTRVREYVSGPMVILDTVFMQWSDRLADNWYYQGYGGYLETMFGGVGGEIMYRPIDSNFAFGVDINYVKQRDPDSTTGFIDYSAVTGFASAYYQPEFLPDTRIRASVGQFLAKDRGINIDFAKRFDSGIVVGAFASFTNVSSEEYGEGSFTKGFYVSVPLDLFILQPATGRGQFPWVPIARDGGQMLNRPVQLIGVTEMRSPFLD
ncbi:YjbH domain-containing protein [uncultured Alteromonas sp.]|uniref:YjbH domain-containing protein n=1 Tax=uncultured Alteromonas sp. TaxID=179113 RepID=UPI0025F58DDF|nr:YjbH domain-containing protein [uncultured Alteromonas sp.]